MESIIKLLHCFMGGHDSAQNTNPSPTPSAGLDNIYYVDEHLEVECPKRFNLSPSIKSLVKKNVATFDAGFRTEIEPLWAFNLQMFLDIVTPIKPSAGSRARVSVLGGIMTSHKTMQRLDPRFHDGLR
nr:MND1-interacting protein 1-like [Ipomoea batatas]